VAGEAILTSGRPAAHKAASRLARMHARSARNPILRRYLFLQLLRMRCRGPEQILSSGFDGYLSKPIDPKLLYRELDRLLSKDASSADRADAAGKGG